MKKDQGRAGQERRAKRAAKTKERRSDYIQKKASAPPPPDFPVAQFPRETQLFWLAHGVNCLLSDYKQGTWTPLFEGIYQDRLPATQEEIQETVMARFKNTKEWPAEAKAALAWTVSTPKLLYVYWHEAMRRMQRAYPELDPHEVEPLIRRQADPCVWDLFNYLMSRLLQRRAL